MNRPNRPAHMVEQLGVFLNHTRVGELHLLPNDNTRFILAPAYLDNPDRPVLGQTFEDDRKPRMGTRSRVPAYFSNLLPEGPLRSLLITGNKLPYTHEFHLLHQLGEDVPGALRFEALEGLPGVAHEEHTADDSPPGSRRDDSLRFSLAGLQLKFSVVQQGDRWTVPLRGLGGEWIAKLPSAQSDYDRIPENEFATMMWARRSGLDVPEVRLVDASMIEGLERWAPSRHGKALLVRRFDRLHEGDSVRRIHQEDFAQVLDVYGAEDGKYQHATFDKLAFLVQRICPDDREEFLRRLVFMVLSGNADMHLKNWSLYYPDGIHARLSPAYDLLATLFYAGTDRKMAFKLGRTRHFEDIQVDSFDRLDSRLNHCA